MPSPNTPPVHGDPQGGGPRPAALRLAAPWSLINFASMDTPTMPENPLLAGVLDPEATRVLRGATSDLAQATRPAFLQNERSPVAWTDSDWEAMDRSRHDLFDMAAVESQFDRDTFLKDGYAIFREIITPQARQDWIAALQLGQQLNDNLLQADWSQIDWHGLGRQPPEESLDADAIRNAMGGSQAVPQSTDETGVRTLRIHSVFAEYFPAGHLPFMMNVLGHPQMLALQRMCLGDEAVYFDHNQLLSRPGGYAGGGWHSHRVGSGYDDASIADIPEYDAQPNALLNLCYLNGFEAGDDGGLKIVRGSHLFRDPGGCRASDDEKMDQGWLAGRRHPVSGEPMEMEHLSLPAGSVVCCLSHAVHGVAPKAAHRDTRWCSLHCYRKADEKSGHCQPPSAVPPVWAVKAQRGELPDHITQLLRTSYDRQLTGGRTESGEA